VPAHPELREGARIETLRLVVARNDDDRMGQGWAWRD
jgi:hypothetical protein